MIYWIIFAICALVLVWVRSLVITINSGKKTSNDRDSDLLVTKELDSLMHYDDTIIVDKVTGVNYIVVICDGISVTPRLNADGSIYISEPSQ